MANVAEKLSSHGSMLIRQQGITNTKKTDAPVRSIVSTIETPTNGVKHHGAVLLRGHLYNSLSSEELARHLSWQLDVVNNRPYIPICPVYKLFLGRSGLFCLHHVG